MIRRALISVSDKRDLVPFARSLAEFGVEIVSTGGTARALSEAGIKVRSVEDVTGFPEMMNGRVKTLHPGIHGGLLGRRDLPSHVDAMTAHNIPEIDLVCINLYPFEKTIMQEGATHQESIEQIDIGGPAALRSASKNHQFVTVVTDTDQYDRVITEMRQHEGATTLELRRDLAVAAFTRTAEYDTAISAWMCSRRPKPFPEMLRLSYTRQDDLRYGENPHQKASVYMNPASGEPSVVTGDVLHGKELSYNNLNDGAAALELVQDLHETSPRQSAAVIIKHTNACGGAVADTLGDAFEQAYGTDPVAAYGGILAVSDPVDLTTAESICEGSKFLEMIIAPGYADAALTRLRDRWKNVRLVDVHTMRHTGRRKLNYKSIPGGMLLQSRDTRLPSPSDWIHAAGPAPTPALLEDAAIMWVFVKHLKSNAIAIGRDGQLLGAGTGQVDRVTACRLAIEKAGERLSPDLGAIATSDAFFPFPDGPRLLIDAGVTCIVQPGGSKRDQATVELCEERGVTCLITGIRHFRH
ncbi:MAG: bifunctional phosphoribosylaminoimidazolecarboxamide formyltransferase/IMP cyclohydrolase [Planctomycetota bacterium]